MFDTALIESAVHPGDHPTQVVRKLPFAIGFHATVIGALVYSALISTAEPPEPVIPILFPSFMGGTPPPPPRGGVEPIRALFDAKPKHVRVDASPTRMPETVLEPVPEAVSETAGVGSETSPAGTGEPGGQPNGQPGGIEGGTGIAEGGGSGASDDAILRPGVGDVTLPELIERIEPVYPESARKLRQDGTVILEAVITGSGTVDDVRVVASRGPLLDAAAMTAVRRWRYRAATLNGRAVAVYLTVTVRFGLNG